MPRFRPNEDSGEDGRRAQRQRLEEAPRESSADAAAKLFRKCSAETINATIGSLRDAQRQLSGDSDRGVFASSCFAVIRNVDGSWFIGSNAQGGQDLYMFTGICVLLAALSQRPGVDRNGHLSTTASKLLRYVAPLVAAFAPRNARVGIIVVNAIPGEYHDAAIHLDYDPENLHGPGIPRGRTCVETNALIRNSVQLVLSIVNPNGLFVDVHSGKVARALGVEIGRACRWRGVHPCALDGSHSAYVRAVLRAVGVEPNIRAVYTALTRNLRSQENARGDLAIDQLMASLDTQDARPRAREDQRKMVREVVQRYARGDSGAVVWAPTGFGKTVILRDLVRLLGESFARTIVLTTVQLVEQTKTAVGRTAENVHILTYSKEPSEQLEDAEHFEGKTLVLADECSRLPSTWKDWIKRRGAFRLLFTATPIRSYLEDLIDLAELVMEFPDDGDTKGAALTSLDLVVHGLGFGNQKGKEEEAAIASADFRDFVERFVVRAKREDIRALLKRSMGENGIASFRTLLHVGDKIEEFQKNVKKLNPELLKKQGTNAAYSSAIAELAPNAAMARLGPEICNELDLHGLLVSPLEEELFRILEGRISEGHTSLVVFPSHVGAACSYLHSAIGLRLRLGFRV